MIRPWSAGFDDSVDWIEKLKMSFVARFNVDNDTIMMNRAEFADDDNAVLIDEVILMF